MHAFIDDVSEALVNQKRLANQAVATDRWVCVSIAQVDRIWIERI